MAKHPMPSDNYIKVPSKVEWLDAELRELGKSTWTHAPLYNPSPVPVLFFVKQFSKEE